MYIYMYRKHVQHLIYGEKFDSNCTSVIKIHL